MSADKQAPHEVWVEYFYDSTTESGLLGEAYPTKEKTTVRYLRADLVDAIIDAGENMRNANTPEFMIHCKKFWDAVVAALEEK